MSLEEHLSSVECISMEKRGFIPNRYYVYVLIVTWNNGNKHPIYRKYSSFYDFERMLREKLGDVGVPELPQMNRLAKAFKLEKNHVSGINEFCQKIMSLPVEMVNSHVVSAFFEVWSTDFPMEESEDRMARKKDDKKKQGDNKAEKQDSSDMDGAGEKVMPSAPDIASISGSSDEDLMGVQVYECIADYLPDRAEELSLREGMKCIVLEKNDDGWWFIMRESDGYQGYAPGSFLCLEQSKATDNPYSETPSQVNNVSIDINESPLMKVRVLTSYEANSGDEISCEVGEELEVLHMDSSGWWTVRSDGKVGLVPAVHLQPCSQHNIRTSEVFFRNNSLYARQPPPRRQQLALDSHSPRTTTQEIHSETDYVSLDDIVPNMAAKRLVPPPSKSKSEGLLNYAEIVFDETDKPKFTKAASNSALKALPKKQDTIIYTEIVPKNLRKPEQPVEDSSIAGRKPERGKALKKQTVPKIEEPKPAARSPSPPTSAEGRESPVPLKPRTARPQEPSRNYENHTVNPSQTFNDNTPTYVNVDLLSTQKTNIPTPQKTSVPTPQKASVPAPQKASVPTPQKASVPTPQKASVATPQKTNILISQRSVASTQQKPNVVELQKGTAAAPQKANGLVLQKSLDSPDYLRRSSIDPPPAPTVEAPIPSSASQNAPPMASYSPSMSRVQASASYDGPPISGMLMFTKGDTATLMSKTSDMGWWYVVLNGLEGYVPGAYWEAFTLGPSSQSRPKAPQPVPRTRSPPDSERSIYEQELWYHGKLSRPESEKLLANFSNGIYVIRESVNRVGDLTLSVRWEGKARHFPIEAKDGGLYYIGKHDFKTLKGVINHYSKHALFYSDANEPVKLKAPATKSTPNT